MYDAFACGWGSPKDECGRWDESSGEDCTADLPFDNLQCMILSKSYEGLTPRVPGALDLSDFLDAIYSARLQERIQGRLRSGDSAAGCSLIDTDGKN
jgi:hypothetical protein